MPNALMLGTASAGIFTLPMDNFGIYWDLVSNDGQPAGSYGYQAIAMSDMHTLWIASAVSGLQRNQGLYTQ